jgi:hypothetical protein
LALLLVSVITALGKDLPLFMLVHRYVPFMDVFRYPEKMLVFTVFFMALFAGFGAETLLEWSAGENGGRRFGRLVKWFLPWVVIVGVALILLTVFGNRISAFVARVNIFGMPVSENAGSYAGYAGALIKDLLRVYGFIITLVLIAVLARTTQKGRLLLGPALVALTALDLYSAHVNLNRLAPEEYYLEPPAVVSHLKNEKGPYRIHPLIFEEKKGSLPLGFTTVFDIYIWEKEALKPNFGAMYGLHYADSESALRLMAQSNYINSAKRAPPGLKERLLGMYNVKYFIALYSQEKAIARDHADMELVQRFDDSGLLLYRNRRYLPRIYHVPAARFVDDQKQALDEIRREGFDPQKEVVITLSGRGDRSSPDPPPGSKKGADDMSTSTSSFSRKGVDIIEYSSSRVSAGASFEQEGYLVLSDVYYPGWEVVVDGKPAELLRANYLFRAVKLPAGTHFVRFQYTPRAFWKGIYAGPPLAGMGALLILIFHFTRRRAGKYT